MKIDKDLILAVAENARLELSSKEIDRFLPQLKEIMETFSKLSEVDTKDVELSCQPVSVKNALREDRPAACLTQEEALKNSQQNKDGYFKGPRII